MTRAQRRKSLAVDQSMALEPGLARSLLDRSLAAEEEEEEREGTAGRGQGQQQQVQQAAAAGQAQQQKRGAAGRRKSVAATQQVGWEPGSKGHACLSSPVCSQSTKPAGWDPSPCCRCRWPCLPSGQRHMPAMPLWRMRWQL